MSPENGPTTRQYLQNASRAASSTPWTASRSTAQRPFRAASRERRRRPCSPGPASENAWIPPRAVHGRPAPPTTTSVGVRLRSEKPIPVNRSLDRRPRATAQPEQHPHDQPRRRRRGEERGDRSGSASSSIACTSLWSNSGDEAERAHGAILLPYAGCAPARHARSPDPRPAHLGHRPLQLPLRLLHAEVGLRAGLPAWTGRAPELRGARAGGRAFVALGVEKIRLTGGEPLLRKEIEGLVARLATIDGLDLTLTTNASLLARKAQVLRDAGLDRINVSLDSLDDATFKSMNDVDFPVSRVEGIDADGGRPAGEGERGREARGQRRRRGRHGPPFPAPAMRSGSSSTWTSARRTAGVSTMSCPPPRSSSGSTRSSRWRPSSRPTGARWRSVQVPRRHGRDRRDRVGHAALLR